ncbi:MAG: hypothetical protein ABL921_13720, partial [Pirellula sp.]
FPAPPAGAYIKLANKVSTRARAADDSLSFYERNSSIYSGEFTDAQRFYFVLEPPNPPPSEPDMDALRNSYEPQPSAPNLVDSSASQGLMVEESATGAKRVLSFNDKRPPHEVKFALERQLRTLFAPAMEHDKLCMRAKANVVGADYDFLLCFEAALPEWNCYSLRAEVSWGELKSNYVDYYRKTSGSWFAYWTADFIAADPPLANESSMHRYGQLCEEAFIAEQKLDSVSAIQQAIVAAVKGGASFCDSNKEGDTRIDWRRDRFVRLDTGDYPDEQHFKDESEFLKMLHQFCYWDATRNCEKDQLSEIDIWRLILRRMDCQ